MFDSGVDENDKAPARSEQTSPSEIDAGNEHKGADAENSSTDESIDSQDAEPNRVDKQQTSTTDSSGSDVERTNGSGVAQPNGSGVAQPNGSGVGESTDSDSPTQDGKEEENKSGQNASTTTSESTSCCVPHSTPGCDDSEVEACVCASEPSCCEEEWDFVCAYFVSLLSCGECKGDCCSANNTPGCNDPEIESCVCAIDESCCEESWDTFCALMVEDSDLNCGVCAHTDPNDCCTPHAAPGCNDKSIQECVCTGDPSCCEESWDMVCVALIGPEMLDCGSCQ